MTSTQEYSGRRGHFPTEVGKTMKGTESETQAENNSQVLTGRFAIMMVTLAILLGLLFLSSSTTSAATLTVTGTGDTIAVDGVVTLREAITAANTNAPSGDAPAGDAGLDVINFNINGSGVQTINLIGALPAITEPITIDGYTQKPCSANPVPCSRPNSLAVGSDAVLLIELNGTAVNAVGLIFNGGNSTLRGLVINRFGFSGISLATNGNNVIAGNFIGTNASGTAKFPSPNNSHGVYVASGNNIVGGTTPADRNVLSGNGKNGPGGSGVTIDTATATGNKVIGNYIGINASGTASIGNYNNGVTLNNCSSNIIGGITPAERNVISSNGSYGVTIGGTASGNQVLGNYIGTKADGTAGPSMGNSSGVSFSNTASNNTIGGTQPGAGNVIAYQFSYGVAVGAQSVNNAILGNSIFSNGAFSSYLGIDLFLPIGVTSNDSNTGDADTGGNKLQNFPVITSALSSAGTTTIQGTLDSAFSTTFRIEFFSNNACDSSGFGEGQNYLGFANATTDASGKGGFSFAVPTASVVGGFFTATATDPNGNTSEFSACASGVVNTPGTLQFNTGQVSAAETAGSVSINVTRTNGSTGTVTVHYATTDGSAKAPSDYTATSGTLTFNDGETTKPLSVPIADDNTPEGTEIFTFALTNPTGGAVLGNATSATLIITDNDLPTLSISDISIVEGNQGNSKATLTVTLSDPMNGQVIVNYATTAGGSATVGSDYQSATGTLTFNSGETVKQIDVFINGDSSIEPDETFFVTLSGPQSATIAKAQAVGTIINDDAPAGPAFEFSQASYSVAEGLSAVTVTVTRTGDTAGSASVDYTTSDETATQKSDYGITAGTLNFAPGESSKSVLVLINQDMYVEGGESFKVMLSNPSGAAIGQPATTVNITDDVPESASNPIDDAQAFVHTHYHDFLNREPDAAGLAFWTNEIASCGNDAQCIEVKRINVSAAYFLSIEFQQTGYLLYLFQKESFGSIPKYNSFMRDFQEVGQGVVVNSPGWEQKLAANQQQFAEKWVNRPAFKTAYDSMSNADYVNALYANAGVAPPQAERDALVTALDTATQTRAAVLLEVAENAAFRQLEQNSAFVLMQYFGYLRRDPDSGPDSDLSGYYFWLTKLNNFNGDYQQAEMVKAFLTSIEYRTRFGQ